MKTMNRYFILGAATAVALSLASCSSDKNQNDPEVITEEVPEAVPYTTLQLTPAQNQARLAGNEFAVSLMKDAMELNDGQSTVLAPFSLYTTLAMVANGDNGTTRDKILETMGFTNGEAGVAQLNDFSAFMIENLPHLDSRAYALVANSLWIHGEMNVREDFTHNLNKWYNAEVKTLPDLHNDAAKNQINEWCASNTNGKIPSFLKQNLTGKMAVINATYFYGIWASGFDKDATAQASFHNLDGTESRVDMMSQSLDNSLYGKTADATIIGIPYGNGNFRMICVLPEGDINEYVSRMTHASLMKGIAQATNSRCIVKMPKFDIGSRQQLLDVLAKKGLACMTNQGFNAIIPNENLAMAQLLQEARVSTDEGGTAGAAVTMAELDLMSPDPDGAMKKPEVNLDRPFLFIIEETSTVTIFFLGAVTRL